MKKYFNRKLNLVVIGAGYMANEYLKTIRSFNDINLFGIFSRTESKAVKLAKKYKIKKIFKSLKEIKECKECDVLIISVSAENNNKLCKLFINTKFLILIEKPIGLNFKESKQIINLANKSRSKTFVALNRRFYDSTIDLKNKIHKKKGKRIVEVFDSQNKSIFRKLKKDKKIINSLMYANSIHLIDYFDLFCRGSVNKVISFKTERKNPSLVISKIQFNSGDTGIYYATWNRYSRWKIKITVNNKIEWVMQPLETLRCYSVSNNKLLFSRSYHSRRFN